MLYEVIVSRIVMEGEEEGMHGSGGDRKGQQDWADVCTVQPADLGSLH